MTQEAVSFRAEPHRAPFEDRAGAPLSAALPRLIEAVRAVGTRPIAAITWVLALVLAPIMALLWGAGFAQMGWVGSRDRLRREGPIGLGELLAPKEARAQFDRGLFSGLWRVHKLSLSLVLIELPTMLLALAPAAIAYAMLMPVQMALSGIPGMILSYGIPALIASLTLDVILAQQILLLRILGASGPRYSTGLVFRAVGVSWAIALRDLRMLLGLGAAFLALSLGAGGFVGISAWLSSLVQLGGASVLILTWTGTIAGLAVTALILESVAGWAFSVPVTPVQDARAFSFSAWLVGFLKAAVAFVASKGARGIGVAACLGVGLMVAIAAIVSGNMFSSWVGLGWFAACAATLLVLDRRGGSER